jgi:hypothetical protein
MKKITLALFFSAACLCGAHPVQAQVAATSKLGAQFCLVTATGQRPDKVSLSVDFGTGASGLGMEQLEALKKFTSAMDALSLLAASGWKVIEMSSDTHTGSAPSIYSYLLRKPR